MIRGFYQPRHSGTPNSKSAIKVFGSLYKWRKQMLDYITGVWVRIVIRSSEPQSVSL